ncbi:MAG: hypothetical protein JWN04_1567 [Myxococcaceae bacterium]|nr:hypothetical protein [Myxococcaceae bacterium]
MTGPGQQRCPSGERAMPAKRKLSDTSKETHALRLSSLHEHTHGQVGLSCVLLEHRADDRIVDPNVLGEKRLASIGETRLAQDIPYTRGP